ncbi:MAG: hypothetical protein EKK57_10145 [Proteobacteria bacterium]|nr:MAG: hypothetical protein EKK57_10145 [Pseudomonadota bacterium]
MLLELNNIKDQIIANCEEIDFVEACGLLCKEGDVFFVVKADNIADNPFDNFIISNQFIEEIAKTKQIVGYYHSHNSGNAEPSIEDLAVISKLNLTCIIYDKLSKTITETNPPAEPFIPPYENRPFIAGILDCSELIRDYYYKSLNITLPKLDHPIKYMSWKEIREKWNKLQHYNKQDYNFYLDYFLNNGFREISKEELNKNDIILIRTREIKAPIHALIYMGNNNILHHQSDRLSRYEDYAPFYRKLSVKYVTYKV